MSNGIAFALISACAFGVWAVFQKQASSYINSLFGALVISLTAVILGMILLWPKFNLAAANAKPRGIVFAILAGVCALSIDYFALKAYDTGLAVSIGAPIIIAVSVAVASLIGFFLGESITLYKILGLVLIIIGSVLLTSFNK